MLSQKPKRFATIVLWLCAVAFIGFGLAFVVQPTAMIVLMGLPPLDGAARLEITTFYGGLEIGLGLFLLIAAARAHWHAPALLMSALAYGALALTRVSLMLMQSIATPVLWYALISELILAILATLAFWRSR
jgi:hypothetical protein